MQAWQWWQNYSMQDTMSMDNIPRRLKLLFITSSIFTVFSLVLFQGYLLTRLVKPASYQPEVQDFKQLLKILAQDNVKLDLMYPEFLVAQQLQQPQTTAMYQLSETLRSNPPIFSSQLDPNDT